MRILKTTARIIIKKSFRLSVWTIEQFSDMQPCVQKAKELSLLPKGTLGKEIANCLQENKLRLVPKFESHDLKHVLLDFKMTPVDEIRMQAFMLGNGNYSLPCFAIIIFGMVLLPLQWGNFYRDFKRGRNAQAVSTWNIDDFAESDLQALRSMIFDPMYRKQPIVSAKKLIRLSAISCMAAGIFGMIFCLPFLFSSSVADLVGAGFPFVGGAVLTIGGLVALSNINKEHQAV